MTNLSNKKLCIYSYFTKLILLKAYCNIKLEIFSRPVFYEIKQTVVGFKFISNLEIDKLENRKFVPKISIEKKKNSYYLNFTIDASFKKVETSIVNSNKLGTAFQSEATFENKDASPLVIDTDVLNNKRNTLNPIVGPFESLKKGKNYFKIFTAKR